MSVFIGCTHESKGDIADLPKTDINKLNVSQFEGSRSKSAQEVDGDYAGKAADENHPNVQEAVKVERAVDVPDAVKGKWKAV
ncbi:MAG: hypothetical protein HN465_05425, partial [Nitrospina sp.]|nr:hypothetical protein [Nitrospina sp.]